MLDDWPKAVPYLRVRQFSRSEAASRITGLAQSLRREADIAVLQGLLALEVGEVGDAELYFREALGLWKNESSAASGAGLTFRGRIIAQGCLKWLE